MIAHVLLVSLQLAAGARLGVQPPGHAVRESAIPVAAGAVAAMAGAAALDERISGHFMAHRSASGERVLAGVEPLGRTRVLWPGMAAVYVAALAAGETELQRATVRVAAGYLVTDAVGGLLKVSSGRGRPDTLNDAWRFRPFARGSEWRSFPSGHTFHAFAIAGGIADETDALWPDVIAYSVASLVAAERVYSRAHWPSDVVAGAIVGMAVSRYGRDRLGPQRREDGGSSLQPAASAIRLVIPLQFQARPVH